MRSPIVVRITTSLVRAWTQADFTSKESNLPLRLDDLVSIAASVVDKIVTF